MATRIETSQRRRELYDSLRRSCRDGSLRQGQLLPSVRELAQQYQISVKLVCATLAVLV
ncbi:MAG: GntR family transcriptional regulator, partial [Cytophagaceae bacterium]